jgi:hypothetical protein
MKLSYILFLSVFLFLGFTGNSQERATSANIEWEGLQKETGYGDFEVWYLSFQGGVVDPATTLPLYTFSFAIDDENVNIKSFFTEAVYEDFTPAENNWISETGYNSAEIEIESRIGIQKKNPLAIISFIPIKYDVTTGKYKKLVSFTVESSTQPNNSPTRKQGRKYAGESVLSSGDWYKIRVSESGIYKITYADLQAYGIDPASINPGNIRLYGNGNGMLPEINDKSKIDDLFENAIVVVGEEDGSFDENDYILFFGQSPNRWHQVLYSYFEYDVNLYSDFNYYFLTISSEKGKRVEPALLSGAMPTDMVNSFSYYESYETEQINLIESGKEWYSDVFGNGNANSRSYSFHVPSIDASEPLLIKIGFANRTHVNDKMIIKINDEVVDSVMFSSVSTSSVVYARVKKKTMEYFSISPDVRIDLEYYPSDISSMAWLNYIVVNAVGHLEMQQGQFLYRDLSSVGVGHISEFHLGNTGSSVQIWDITNNVEPRNIDYSYSNNEAVYVLPSDSIREFIAFDGTSFYSPEFEGMVVNQNLHGYSQPDLVIVTYPDFYQAAERLKTLHETRDGMSVILVTLDQIYNEFSSGGQDPSAIRDFLKMLYDNSDGSFPRFLLLMGDGSYDPKERVEHNTNYIPAFQTAESWNSAGSIMTDDYYGFLDDGEGNDASGILDLGIGRLPVQTLEEANDLVDKIETYLVKSEPQFGSWRNQICIIADDEDGNLHLDQADSLANIVNRHHKNYNVNKVYLDAYTQLSTPRGPRYPDVTDAINNHMDEGTLIMNYVGHGGESGWAGERILVLSDINGWDNADKLPIFVTATCEFSRFDDPEKRSGGELVLMNNKGGGIALFTTVRLAYSQANFSLNIRFYQHVFEKINGKYPYMGDVIRDSKPPGSLSTRNFTLLGDPAIRIAYPEYDIVTSEISTINSSHGDTLCALSEVMVTGTINDFSGEKVNDFTGLIYPVVYDKPAEYRTLGNDQSSYERVFYIQNRILHKATVSVSDGDFSFSFVVPRDIALSYGKGKISYYAMNDYADATGHSSDFVIGGLNTNAVEDDQGPQIQLFLNDEGFVSGDQVNPSPLMIAYLYDDHGINFSENGIGHDIVATLDGDHQSAMVMNEYFEPVMDEFQKGNINYLFNNLSNGKHTLTLKVWDTYNNSSTASIDFVIDQDSKLLINRVMNHPNPFSDRTWFTFKHTRPAEKLDVEIQIFDLNGRSVLKSTQSFTSIGITSPLLEWDGTDASGNPLKNGMYIYSILVTDENGEQSRQTQKLVLMKD